MFILKGFFEEGLRLSILNVFVKGFVKELK
jgi:hypothetical protein